MADMIPCDGRETEHTVLPRVVSVSRIIHLKRSQTPLMRCMVSDSKIILITVDFIHFSQLLAEYGV